MPWVGSRSVVRVGRDLNECRVMDDLGVALPDHVRIQDLVGADGLVGCCFSWAGGAGGWCSTPAVFPRSLGGVRWRGCDCGIGGVTCPC